MDLCFFYCTLSSILTFLPDCYSSSEVPFSIRLPGSTTPGLITENRHDLWEVYKDQIKKEAVRDWGSFCFFAVILRFGATFWGSMGFIIL